MIRVVHSGSRIRILTFSHPGSRIQGSKRHPIPDPGSATLENNQKIFTFTRTNFLKTKIKHRTFCLCTTRIPKTLDSTGSLDSDPRWQIDIKSFKKEYSLFFTKRCSLFGGMEASPRTQKSFLLFKTKYMVYRTGIR